MTTTASWYHCSVKVIGRTSGRSAVAAAAYRLGERLHDERYDLVHDFTRKGGVLERFTFAPDDAPDWALDPERLWNAAEAVEKRKNSCVAREVELALPAFLAPWERRQIVQQFSQELVDRYGVAVSAALHEPGKGDPRNFHAHILFTTREVGADGLGQKTRILDDRKTGPQEVVKLRERAADLINATLIAAGSDIRVDHRSFKARGIEQEPTSHLGPAASEMERRGEKSDRGDINREAAKANAERQEMLAERDALDDEIAAERQRETETASDMEVTFTPETQRAVSETLEELGDVAVRQMQRRHRDDGDEDQRRTGKASPRDAADARRRVRDDVEPFATGIAERGAVADLRAHDGVPWWQRLTLRVMEMAHMLAREALGLWREQERGERQQPREPERGGWER